MFFLQVPSSTYSTMLLLLIAYLIALIRANPDIGGSHGGEASHLDVDDPDFSGIVDFSNAIPGNVTIVEILKILVQNFIDKNPINCILLHKFSLFYLILIISTIFSTFLL